MIASEISNLINYGCDICHTIAYSRVDYQVLVDLPGNYAYSIKHHISYIYDITNAKSLPEDRHRERVVRVPFVPRRIGVN